MNPNKSKSAPVHIEKKNIKVDNIFKKAEVVEYDLFIETFDKKLEELLELHKAEKFLKSYLILEELETNLDHYKNDHKEEEIFKSIFEKFHNHSQLFSQMKNTAKEIMMILSSFNDDQDFVLARDKHGLKIEYRQEKDKPTVSLKMEGIIEAPIFNLLSVANELDLWCKFIPRLEKSDIIKEVSKFSKVVYVKMGLPVISDREAYLIGYGVDLLEHDCILIIARDVTPAEMEKVPPPSGNDVRLEVAFAAFLFQPLKENVTRFQFFGNADPKLSIIPYWLINWGVKTMAPYFFDIFKKQSTNLPEIYHKRIEENQFLYGDLKQRVSDYFKRNEKN
eukprot:TRINITY_DN13829_c0_g1_i1.p1 TRINITY_DN13829_c0_g1~~TRINITY_DN13829_c0_g1_i1.p1  ORF type:complete len:335 (+),score=89.36 TRINITY_DN13829_c0_g1_i1:2-1006(+)